MVPVSYDRDLSRYTHCQQHLHDMDLYSQYGPWPTLYETWEDFTAATGDVARGTVAMEVETDPKRNFVVAKFDGKRWKMAVRRDDRVVLSSSHPCLDLLMESKVLDASSGRPVLEWKENSGSFDDLVKDAKPKTVFAPPRPNTPAWTPTSTRPTSHACETPCAPSRASQAMETAE